ncbi:hypothetical protein DH86_00004030 [Scytalidium sp. 3C]|nr:hypothetical protein DH86_00004030 [Scytalidium sp. 3C]
MTSQNPIVAKLQYGMKITFIFILILFIDSVNRVYRVQVEVYESKDQGAAAVMGHERAEVQARKFYSQRNMYLCGFTLFLSLILNRTYIMILEILQLEEKIKQYEGPSASGKGGAATSAGSDEVAQLKKELAQKDRDLQTLKKQSEGLSREYNNLGDKFTTTDATPKKDR